MTTNPTPNELALERVCRASFLRMWAHRSPYNDKRDKKTAGRGKELCDLLAVFEDDLFIFQEKTCQWPKKGDLALRWSRWKRRTITDATEQVIGAEKWLYRRPERVFADPACTTPLPVALPAPERQRVHRIVVASGAMGACRAHFGEGRGALTLETHPEADDTPFTVGCTAPTGEFVHIFDEATFELIIGELDTIPEFRNYLLAKERLVCSGKRIIARGEENILGHYLQHEDAEQPNNHGFGHAREFKEGIWDKFERSPHKSARDKINRYSYDWDALINKAAKHSIEGTQYRTTHGDPRLTERTLRCMNSEPRMVRRVLVERTFQQLSTMGERSFRFWSCQSPTGRRTLYTFIALRHEPDEEYDEYIRARNNLLLMCTTLMRLERPGAGAYVGIGMGTFGAGENGSEDLLLLTDEAFTPGLQEEARSYQRGFGLLANLKEGRSREREYPSPMLPLGTSKGAARNAPCPCRSGMKWKKCCGRSDR